MGELTIRRNRGFAPVQYQPAGRGEKPSAASRSQRASGGTGFTVSDSLRQLMSRVSQAESHTRASRRTLRTGEAVLAEVQNSLGRIEELVRQSSGDGAPNRAELQAELERLREEIDRMIGGASAGGERLFLDEEMGGGADSVEALLFAVMGESSAKEEAVQALPDWLVNAFTQGDASPEQLLDALGLDKNADVSQLLAAVMGDALESNPAVGRLAALYLGAVIIGGPNPENVTPEAAMEGLRLLAELVANGVPPDEAIAELTDGAFTSFEDFQEQFSGGTAPGLREFLSELLLGSGGEPPQLAIPSLLTFLAGLEGMDLDLLLALLTVSQTPQTAPAAENVAAPHPSGGEAAPTSAPAVSMTQGELQAVGRDLAGVSFDANGALTLTGPGDVTILGAGRGQQSLLLAGTGTAALHRAALSLLTVDTASARLLIVSGSAVEELRLSPGAVLTLGGGGLLRLGSLRAEGESFLRLASGAAVAVTPRENETMGALAVPVVMDGPASLAAHASAVRDPAGRTLTPFDVVWKTLLPGFSAITSLAVDGRQTKMALLGGENPDPVRLWLAKGDPNHGYPIHAVMIRGRDSTGRPLTRYAYLRWDQRAGAFREISMRPNPFAITGGEQDRDWVYEQETCTLRILSNQVTAISGGSGIDANQIPFSGRIALADGIGAMELTLGGVICRVSAGRAFSLGRANEVTLLLQDGTDNCFESGAGCAGISLGEGTSLCVDCAGPRPAGGRTPGVLTASGGAGGAGIGRDSGVSQDLGSHIVIRGGVITAAGAGGGAGIGAGKRGAMGSITILGGTVTSTGGNEGGAGIGGALGARVGDIRIRGGTIAAVALCHAAAIGAGVQGESGNILIAAAARIIKAQGGDPGADIGSCLFGGCGEVQVAVGADLGGAKLRPRMGISLRMGEEAVTLPQFRLSVRSLQLDGICISTRERARAAGAVINADRRWVAQLQTAYGALYSRLEQSRTGLESVCRHIGAAGSAVRTTDEAGALLEDMRQSILLPSSQAVRTHSKRSLEDARHLLG